MTDEVPLSARVSQLLVAYTIEVDNLFDLRMIDGGFDEYGLSLVAWSNLMQYVDDEGVSCQTIMDCTYATASQVAQVAGTLERWFVVEVQAGKLKGEKRPGWLTSKGITPSAILRPTAQGALAREAWAVAVAEVERRWAARWPDDLGPLREVLAHLAGLPKVAMPDGVPSGWLRGDWRQFPAGDVELSADAATHVLLSRALLALTIAFERESPQPLALLANTVRVLSPAGVPLSAVAPLCGLPSQMSSVQVTAAAKAGLAAITPDPASKIGKKLVALTKMGAAAQQDYLTRSASVEADIGRFAGRLRTTLRPLLDKRITHALTPPEGVRRAGTPHSPLGLSSQVGRSRGDQELYVGAGQEARNKELVAQTQDFLADPAGRLPHYPVWDQNRGFGP